MTKKELGDLIDKRSERADYFNDETHVLHLADAEKIAIQYAKEAIKFTLNQREWDADKVFEAFLNQQS